MKEFALANEALVQQKQDNVQKQDNNISSTQSHSQAHYKSCLLDFTEKVNETLDQEEEAVSSSSSECFDCVIITK